MKALFIVGAKLLGLYYITSSFIGLLAMIFVRVPSIPGMESAPYYYALAARFAVIFLKIGIGLFLISYPQGVATALGIRGVHSDGEIVKSEIILPVGISLIGLSYALSMASYILVGLPAYLSSAEKTQQSIGLGDFLGVGIALWLMFKPLTVSNLITVIEKKQAS